MTNLALIVSLMLGTQQLQCGGSDIGKTVRDSLFNEVVRQDRAADAAWLACDTKEKLAEHQAWVRAGVLSVIGGLPEKTPLNARVTGRVKKDGYVIEKVLFESRPHHYVTAHLFLPDNPKYKATTRSTRRRIPASSRRADIPSRARTPHGTSAWA